MALDIAADVATLSLFIACVYMFLHAYARRRRPQWTEHLTQRRLAVFAILTLAVGGIKLIEDVVAKESGPVDEAVLWLLRDHVPAALNGFFAAVTLSGSAKLLLPLSGTVAVVLLVARRRFEALLVGASVVTATLVVWGMKAIVGRARPALWEAQWYWGSSFPSGHTLSTAAFATAAALCVRGSGLEPGAWPWCWPCCGQAWSPSRASCSVCTGPRTCWLPCVWVRSSPC